MSRYVVSIFVLLCFYGFSVKAQEEKVYLNEKIEALWETSAELKTPESVYYYDDQNVIFVANINGKPTEKDDNGFISKLTSDGEIVNLEWVKGLHAPKGMGVYKDKLFVTDIDRIAEIDIQTSKIVKFYDVAGAMFLNDITIGKSGEVYVSDMRANIIYKLYKGEVVKWFTDNSVTGPNGLCIAGEYLLIGTRKNIVKVNLKDKKLSEYISDTGGIDGLVYRDNKDVIYSDWSGNVYIAAKDKEIVKLLDTTPLKINAADIDFDHDKGTIFVPTFYDNRVMAYQLKE